MLKQRGSLINSQDFENVKEIEIQIIDMIMNTTNGGQPKSGKDQIND